VPSRIWRASRSSRRSSGPQSESGGPSATRPGAGSSIPLTSAAARIGRTHLLAAAAAVGRRERSRMPCSCRPSSSSGLSLRASGCAPLRHPSFRDDGQAPASDAPIEAKSDTSEQKYFASCWISAATRHDAARAGRRVVLEGISRERGNAVTGLCGGDAFARLRSLHRATNGHQRPAQKPVQGPCYKQACRTIFSFP
jgi:hypothetical protein